MVTVENHTSLRRRRRGAYLAWKDFFKRTEFLSKLDLYERQNARLREFLEFAVSKSRWHGQRLNGIDVSQITVDTLHSLPLMTKEDLRRDAHLIETVDSRHAYVAKTGGTTGAALQLHYRWDDFQERSAMLDAFRERFIPILESRIAWFSGKALIPHPERERTFSRTNWVDGIRYYSTFHISPEYVENYITDLNRFSPEVIVGFPSSLVELARCARNKNIAFSGGVRVIFPTSEAVTPEDREIMSSFFGGEVRDQYASSEGAPFITECPSGKLHCELMTGVFEVLDETGNPAKEGDLVVTAFGTRGTPLIRYQIEDRIALSEEECSCGRNTPVVARLDGRRTDFVYAPARGKVNLVNISNSVKGVHGIRKFQILQSEPSSIELRMAIDPQQYTSNDEKLFLANLRDRFGNSLVIHTTYVDDIPRDRSGKHRILINSMPHLP
jgi:phenylacetate-CoA ligase